jgi:hypothetical protein
MLSWMFRWHAIDDRDVRTAANKLEHHPMGQPVPSSCSRQPGARDAENAPASGGSTQSHVAPHKRALRVVGQSAEVRGVA